MTIDHRGRLALLLALALSAGACGLKGDLYLPEEQTRDQAPPATTPAESERAPADGSGDEPADDGDDADGDDADGDE